MQLTQNLTQLSYRLHLDDDSEGGGSQYTDYKLSSFSKYLLRLSFKAEWATELVIINEVEIEFQFYEDAPLEGVHVYRGPLPLQGEFELSEKYSRKGDLSLHIRPLMNETLPVWAIVTPMDQPINFTLQEVYRCH